MLLSHRLLTDVLGVDAKSVRACSLVRVEDAIEVRVRPRARFANRCPHCDRRCAGYDSRGSRRWRSLDWGRVRVFVVAVSVRVKCPEHGVVVASVPWARHRARHTLSFEQLAAWSAVEMSSTAASRLWRTTWRTIGAIVTRVVADLGDDHYTGITRIGIDEISYRRHHKYLLVVVDHDRKRLVHAVDGANAANLNAFFDRLGEHGCNQLSHVSADGAPWIERVVTARCPDAVLTLDTFHVVAWANDALDAARRTVWNQVRLRRKGAHKRPTGEAKKLKDARWALRKNPDNHSDKDRLSLEYIHATHPDLAAAWALKESLRVAVTGTGETAIADLDAWIVSAHSSGLDPFITLAERISRYRQRIIDTIESRLTNALVESFNTKIRVICRRAFGFHNTEALIALARLTLAGERPQLPT